MLQPQVPPASRSTQLPNECALVKGWSADHAEALYLSESYKPVMKYHAHDVSTGTAQILIGSGRTSMYIWQYDMNTLVSFTTSMADLLKISANARGVMPIASGSMLDRV